MKEKLNKILFIYNILSMNSTLQTEILYLNFNQDQGSLFNYIFIIQGMFCVGTDQGFRIYASNEFEEKFIRDLKGGISIVEMLYRSNIVALVGGGSQPKYPENKVIIWDDSKLEKYLDILDHVKCVGEMSFRDKVKNVKLKSDKVVVVLEKKVFVYNFTDLKMIDQIETCPNLKGICALNTHGEQTILVTPDKTIGKVQVNYYGKNVQQINAHQSQISFLALNQYGTRLATASEKGTVIRIFDTLTGNNIQEVRRGSDYAKITCLTFDQNGNWLACASDQGTIHVFGLQQKENKDQQEQQQTVNPKSFLGFLGPVIPILKSEWSFAQFRIPDSRCKIAFTEEPNTFIAISYEGNYYKAQFDPEKGGECIKKEERKIINA